jgi:hypothetical protein
MEKLRIGLRPRDQGRAGLVLPVQALRLPEATVMALGKVGLGVRRRVRKADGPERIFGEWWLREGERDAVRDYFQLEDEVGARFWVFRRGDGERPVTGDLTWWMHELFG